MGLRVKDKNGNWCNATAVNDVQQDKAAPKKKVLKDTVEVKERRKKK
jgi:hypothetical protein